VNNIELLDSLIDDLTSKQIQVKALEVQKRQLEDAKRGNLKSLKKAEGQVTHSKVFLDLKDERRRQQIRLNKAHERKEKLAEQIKLIKEKAESAMEKAHDDMGLEDVNIPSIINMQKKDQEQKKQLAKLRQQIAAINGSFDTMKTKTSWADRDQEIILEDLQSEINKVKAEINKKEQLIMSNQNMSEKPPHFLEPLSSGPSSPASPQSINSKASPRRPPPKRTSPGAKKTGAGFTSNSSSNQGSPLVPQPPAQKKKGSPTNKHQTKEEEKKTKTPTPPPATPPAEEQDNKAEQGSSTGSSSGPAADAKKKSPTPPASSRSSRPSSRSELSARSKTPEVVEDTPGETSDEKQPDTEVDDKASETYSEDYNSPERDDKEEEKKKDEDEAPKQEEPAAAAAGDDEIAEEKTEDPGWL